MTKNENITTALIDFDILCFEAGHKSDGLYYFYPEVEFETPYKEEMDRFIATNELDPSLMEVRYNPLPISVAYECIDSRIKEISEFFPEAQELKGFLTGKGNFRYRIATILPYKGNRRALRKPAHLPEIRQYLIEKYKAVETKGEEADDALGYNQTETSCICSTDKDFNSIPGWHMMWQTPWNKEAKKWWVSELDATRFFYKQLLTGDKGDNVLGLHGIGPTSTYLKKIDKLENEKEMFDIVYALYHQRFGQYAEPFLLETGRLLKIRRSPEEMWSFPQ